jgi:hypothetical protein
VLLASQGAYAEQGIPVTLSGAFADGSVYHLKTTIEVEAGAGEFMHQRPMVYLAFAPGLVVFLVLLFWRRGAKPPLVALVSVLFLSLDAGVEERVGAGVDAFLAGQIQESLDLFAQAEQAMGGNPALAYNRALCHHVSGRRGPAVAALMRAITLDPGNEEYRAALARFQADYGLSDLSDPGPRVNPDVLFLLTVVLANLTLVALGLVVASRSGTLAILFVLALIATAGMGGFFAYVERARSRPIRVVLADESPLKRAPLADASAWMHLPEGLILRLRGEAAGYALVETGLGLEGWIETALLMDPADTGATDETVGADGEPAGQESVDAGGSGEKSSAPSRP